MAQRDHLKDELEQLEIESQKLLTILNALREESDNLPPADNIEELEIQLEIPKKQIKKLIKQIGTTRNTIQQLETDLSQHQHKLQVIQEYNKLRTGKNTEAPKSQHVCPNCGYMLDEEIFDIVHKCYTESNESYLCQQIQLIVDSVSEKLSRAKQQYVSLMEELKKEETQFKADKDEFEVYVRQRGLQDSIRRFSQKSGANAARIESICAEIKEIDKEIKKLPNKKDVEEKYIEFVRLNIMHLGAWDPTYDGNIRLLKPIKAQGTLENKIILAQFVGLFQTMEYFKTSVTRFPFVVDSPRAKEPSHASSVDILKMISGLNMLPQVILATIDFQDYENELEKPAKLITLSEPRKLLSESDFAKYEDLIKRMESLLTNT